MNDSAAAPDRSLIESATAAIMCVTGVISASGTTTRM